MATYILYWMTATRRPHYNFGLQRAVEHAVRLAKAARGSRSAPCRPPVGRDRFHQFAVDGMRDNAQGFQRPGVRYHPYLERSEGEGRRLARSARRPGGCRGDRRLPLLLPSEDGGRRRRRLASLPRGRGRQRPAAASRHPRRSTPPRTRSGGRLQATSARAPRQIVHWPIRSPPLQGTPPELPAGVADALARCAPMARGVAQSTFCRSTTRVRPVNCRGGYRAAREVLQRVPGRTAARVRQRRAITPTATPRAGCRRTCTGVTCRRTKSSTRSMTREGWLGDAATPRHGRARRLVGCRRQRPRRFSISW